MASLNEIAYNIAEGLNKAYDISFIERVKFSVVYHRASYLNRIIRNMLHIPSVFVQDLGCVDVVKGDLAECCDVAVATTCSVFKTTVAVPATIPLVNKPEYIYVGGIGQIKPYKPIEIAQLPYELAGKYTGKLPKYSRHPNGKIYVFNDKPKKINIKGVFEDPRVAADFNKCSGEVCYSDDMEFPASGKMIHAITTGLLSGELRLVEMNDERVDIKG